MDPVFVRGMAEPGGEVGGTACNLTFEWVISEVRGMVSTTASSGLGVGWDGRLVEEGRPQSQCPRPKRRS